MLRVLKTHILATTKAAHGLGHAQRILMRRISIVCCGLATACLGVAMVGQMPVTNAGAAVTAQPALQTNATDDKVLAAALLASDNSGPIVEASETSALPLVTEATLPAIKETNELLRDSDTRPAVVAKPKARKVYMEVTAYCACSKCCGSDASGITASGKKVSYNRGRFVAADTNVLPFGTKLSIPGYHNGLQVEVIDRGGAIKGRKLDVYFDTHDAAMEWGRRMIPVTVYEKTK